MSSINTNYIAAQSTSNPLRRSSDGPAFRAAISSNGRQNTPTTLNATPISSTTSQPSNSVAQTASGNGAPQRPLRPGSIINILV